jgi:hypothetical protein
MGLADDVLYDRRGWLTVDGPRFWAFFPLGSRAQLEHDILLLAEAYGWDPPTVKQMTCSERHRFVKMKKAIAAEERARANNQTTMPQPTPSTGISQRADMPSFGLDYSG